MSRCTNDSRYTLFIGFDSDVDLDLSHVLVQNRVNLALPAIPAVVQNEGIVVRKLSPVASMIVLFISPNSTLYTLYLGHYASHLRDELGRVVSVGSVSQLGGEDPS